MRYFKFKGVNGEDRIIREQDSLTDTFISGRWMREPSLIAKINGTDHDETVMEISEKEAMTIIGVPQTSKTRGLITYIASYFSYLIGNCWEYGNKKIQR